MKKITFTLFAIISIISSAFAQNIDSLQKQRNINEGLCAKADLYINKADSLIQFGEPKTRLISIADATAASDYVLKAIQINKKFDDTLSVRNNFDRLGQAYIMQNKFTEAKWYILQSNCISRDAHDVPHIIGGLMQLASVKIEIKDYALAQKDLEEAIVLSKYEYNVPQQIEVEKKLAALYDKTNRLKEAKNMVQHYTQLADNLKKAKAPQVLAMQKPKVKVRKVAVTAIKQDGVLLDEQVPVSTATVNALANNN